MNHYKQKTNTTKWVWDVAQGGNSKRHEEERSSERFKAWKVLEPGFEDKRKGQQAKECRRPPAVENDY